MFNKSVFNRKDPVPRREASTAEPAGNGLPAAMANDKAFVRVATPAREQAAPAGISDNTPRAISPVGKESKESKETKESSGKSVSDVAGKEEGARLIVGPEVKLKGAQILDCDTLVVEGYVEATMDSRVIRVAEHGSFNGKVSVDIAEIHGSFDGELTARLQLTIHSTARVKGSIRYGKLVADEGCELCGNVSVLSGELPEKRNSSAMPEIALGAGN